MYTQNYMPKEKGLTPNASATREAKRSLAFTKQWNGFALSNLGKEAMFDVNQTADRVYAAKEKDLTGAGGQANLIGDVFSTEIFENQNNAGAFQQAGARIDYGVPGKTYKMTAATDGDDSGYVDFNYSTDVSGDLDGTWEKKELTVTGKSLKVLINKDVIQDFLGRGDAFYDYYRRKAQRARLLKIDEDIITYIATTANNFNGIVPPSVDGVGKLLQAVHNGGMELRQYNGRVAAFLRWQDLNTMMTSRDKNGNTLASGLYRLESTNEPLQLSLDKPVRGNAMYGYVGMLGNIELYITKGVKSTYEADTSGDITNATTGTKSGVFLANPDAVNVRVGKDEVNEFEIFKSDWSLAGTGQIGILDTFFEGAGVASVQAANYYIIQ